MVKIVNDNEVYSPQKGDDPLPALEDCAKEENCQEQGSRFEQTEQRRQNTLLAGVAEAARRLLVSSLGEGSAIADFDAAVNGALEAIAQATGMDRIAIFQHRFDLDLKAEVVDCPYEWTVPGIVLSPAQSGRFPMAYSGVEGFSSWIAALRAGHSVQALPREMPATDLGLQGDDQALSVLSVPIFIDGDYWGHFGFDDYTTERVWSEADIVVLETAAACIGSAIERDRTHREKEEAVKARIADLTARDRILEATAAAANVMLTNDDFDHAVNQALKTVGEGLSVDRVALLQHFDATAPETVGYAHCLYEWATESITKQTEHPELVKLSDEGFEFVIEDLRKGQIFGGIVEEFPNPFRSALVELDVQSTYAIPILVNGTFWGSIALDDCHQQTRRSESELEALKTLANCVGSALERDRSQKAREAAEREALIAHERAARAAELEVANQVLTTRDRWLETTAIAASELLSTGQPELTVNAALQIIGENLACDRVGVMRHLPVPDSLGRFRVLYEWDSSGAINQMATDDLVELPASDFADWTKRLMAKASVGGPTAEQQEPFRSKLQALGTLCAYAVPIFMQGEFWGLMFMDYCHEARQLTSAELAVFETTATCVGSAISQAQVRRDRAAQERSRLLGSVAQAANLLLRSADYTTVLPEVVQLLGEAVGSDRCSIAKDEIHQPSGNLVVTLLSEWCKETIVSSEETAPDFRHEGLVVLESHFSEFHHSFLRGEISNVLVSDLTGDERLFLEAQGVTSMLLVPIMVQGKCWGEIGFDNCGKPRLYDEAEISILQVAAESIASAIARQAQDEALRTAEKAVLKEREKAARDRATELANTNEALSQTLNVLTTESELDGFLGKILIQISQKLGVDDSHLFLYDKDTHTLSQHIVVQAGQVFQGNAPGDPDIFKAPVPADITRAWQIASSASKPFTIDEDHPESAEFLWPGIPDWHAARGHQSATCACMKVGNQAIGFIGFAFCDRTVLTEEQLEFIQALTNQATLAIQLTRLADQAQTAALSAALNDERTRLAREIHDTLAQAFTGVSLQLEAAKSAAAEDVEDTLYHISRAGDLARRGLSEARRSVRALRSQALETDTLPNALRTALQEMTQASATQAKLQLKGTPYPLPEDIQTNLLRIGQEATINTLRHAEADTLILTLDFAPRRVRMSIIDDGKGCNMTSFADFEGFGLVGMRERVHRFDGKFSFTSAPGEGTVIVIEIPIGL